MALLNNINFRALHKDFKISSVLYTLGKASNYDDDINNKLFCYSGSGKC